jgi:hypothetical protein
VAKWGQRSCLVRTRMLGSACQDFESCFRTTNGCSILRSRVYPPDSPVIPGQIMGIRQQAAGRRAPVARRPSPLRRDPRAARAGVGKSRSPAPLRVFTPQGNRCPPDRWIFEERVTASPLIAQLDCPGASHSPQAPLLERWICHRPCRAEADLCALLNKTGDLLQRCRIARVGLPQVPGTALLNSSAASRTLTWTGGSGWNSPAITLGTFRSRLLDGAAKYSQSCVRLRAGRWSVRDAERSTNGARPFRHQCVRDSASGMTARDRTWSARIEMQQPRTEKDVLQHRAST